MSVTGRFYFKRTVNGNLIGEFSNNHANKAFTESADVQNCIGGFVGTYNSTWQESGKARFAKLEIAKSGDVFSLKWTGQDNYIGNGMMCDDILIGDYHDI